MSSPGAEHAPYILVGYVTERGSFYHTEAELPLIQTVTGEWVTTSYAPARRQLDVNNPDDMRAIWYRAALALGTTEGEALSARMWRTIDGWALGIGQTEFRPVIIVGQQADIKHATAALCLHVWGPR